VDYRLVPEHRFPAGLDDGTDVALWVSGHAGELGGIPGRLALAGDSAGGTSPP
jgi:acetyl esterase/lipase